MRLRHWQADAIAAAKAKFETPYAHFLCLATPGAGKTVMASALADSLLKENKIDLVLCFSPSAVVAGDFKVELEAITQKRFCGGLGASGASLTYQSMRFLDSVFWSLLDSYRVLVIFDEIHHCAGHQTTLSNAWGESILQNIQGKARYTLALTGTPWRSDTLPISLASYLVKHNTVHVDYRYTLTRAIDEGVCRAPHITVLDNELITVLTDNNKDTFSSFSALLNEGGIAYLTLIQHEEIVKQILLKGIERLRLERQTYADAAGLVVASSIAHARQIQHILSSLGESSVIVTYQEDSPTQLIRQFKGSHDTWIISISMISEGTNIPRLRVCCYLSLVTTELYFRQVIGRVLRVQYAPREVGYFIMPAHPRLTKYAQRLADEIPHFAVLSNGTNYSEIRQTDRTTARQSQTNRNVGHIQLDLGSSDEYSLSPVEKKCAVISRCIHSIDTFGRFKQLVYEL